MHFVSLKSESSAMQTHVYGTSATVYSISLYSFSVPEFVSLLLPTTRHGSNAEETCKKQFVKKSPVLISFTSNPEDNGLSAI